MSRPWIYVAGPYTRPDPVLNTHRAIKLGDQLYGAGFFPIVPHVTLLQQLVVPQDVEYWYRYDLNFVDRCDALVRMPGESTGSDREVEYAYGLGKPVLMLHSHVLTPTTVELIKEMLKP